MLNIINLIYLDDRVLCKYGQTSQRRIMEGSGRVGGETANGRRRVFIRMVMAMAMAMVMVMVMVMVMMWARYL